MTRNWVGPTGSNWFAAPNWSPIGVPDPSDSLTLGVNDQPVAGGAVSISHGGSILLNSASSELTALSLSVGDEGSGSLVVRPSATLNTGTLILGESPGSHGDAVFSGANVSTTGNLSIGFQGDGDLLVNRGADVSIGANLRIGNEGESTGALRVGGSVTTVDVVFGLELGIAGAGSLDLYDLATLTYATGDGFSTGDIRIGSPSSDGASAHVTVRTGAQLVAQSPIEMLVFDRLDIENGGLATGNDGATVTGGGILLDGRENQALVNVSGGDSLWDLTSGVSNPLDVGNAEVNVRSGGVVRAHSAEIAASPLGGSSLVTVEGAGSLLDLGLGSLTLGGDGPATLGIADGGRINSGVVTLDTGAALTVRGANSVLAPRNLSVGPDGDASLSILDGGRVESTGNSTLVGALSGTNSSVLISGSGSAWDHADIARVANAGEGSVVVENGGLFRTGDLTRVGVIAGSSGDVRVSGPGSRWQALTQIQVGDGGTGTLTVEDGGTVTSGSAILGNNGTGDGTVVVTDPGSAWSVTNSVTVGNNGDGALAVRDGGRVDIGTNVQIGASGTLTIDGGTVVAGGLAMSSGGTLNHRDGELVIDGGSYTLPASADLELDGIGGTATLTLRGPGTTTWTNNVVLVGLSGSAVMNIESGYQFTAPNNVEIGSQGVLNLDGGHLRLQGELAEDGGQFNFVSGTVELDGGELINHQRFDIPSAGVLMGHSTVPHNASPVYGSPGSQIVVSGGDLGLGSTSSFNGFVHEGTITVGSDTLLLHSRGFAQLGSLTTISNSTIEAANGVSLGTGDVLVGNGTVDAKVSAAAGSVIESNDTLTLGDPNAFDGFVSAGQLNAAGNDFVYLLDRNQAQLGSLTTLVDDTTVSAANGVILDFGSAITGFGTIEGSADPAFASYLNGSVLGATGFNVFLKGYFRGVGSLDNVFCGVDCTLSPGLSPAEVFYGTVDYEGTLEIELGGTTAGGDFDRISHTLGAGTADLGGELDVSFINGFTPTAGDSFEIIDAASVVGTFDTEDVPAIGGGFFLDVLYSSTAVTLSVEGLAGDYNYDGVVDAADYTVWRDALGTTGEGLAADGDLNGVVDASDRTVWQNNYGATVQVTSSRALSQPVPEPGALALAAFFMTGLLVSQGCAAQRHRRSS